MDKERILQLLLAGGRPQPNTSQQPADEVFEAFLARGTAHPSTQPMDAQLQQLLNRVDNHPANVPADSSLMDAFMQSEVYKVDNATQRWETLLSNPRNADHARKALENTVKFGTDETEKRIAQQYLDKLNPPATKKQAAAKPSDPQTIDPAATASGATIASQAEVLEGLLYELSTTRSVDDEAAFISRLRDLQHGEGATPEQRAAAFQVRFPNVEVSTTPDGRLSFSDRSAPLNVDSATAERMQRVKAQAEMLNFENPIIIGSDDTVRVLGGRTTAEAASRLEGVRNTLFGASNSPSVQALQSRLDSITSIEDPTERFEALQAMRPAMTAFANERRAEIRNQVFDQYRIHELQQRLAAEEAKDRADPQYAEFGGADSEITANLRQQLRVAQSDAMAMVDRQIANDPLLSTLNSNYQMVEALVNRKDATENTMTFADMYNMVDPATKNRMDTMGAAILPNWESLTPSQRTKAMQQNPIIAAAARVAPTEALSFISKPGTEAKQWLEYIRQSEKQSGATDAQLEDVMEMYSRESTLARQALAQTDVNRVDSSLRGIVEQVNTARKQMSPSDFANALEQQFMPMAVQARLNAVQSSLIAEADEMLRVNPGDTTGNSVADAILANAKDQQVPLGDLTRAHSLIKLVPRGINTRGNLLTPGTPEEQGAIEALAAYVSRRRMENQLSSVLVSPMDTTNALVPTMKGGLLVELARYQRWIQPASN